MGSLPTVLEESRAERSSRWLASAHCLQVDQWTAEVFGALHAHGLRPVLLKGPPVARWLYPDDPAARRYLDVDVLLGPSEIEEARAVLGQLGFQRRSAELADEVQVHAQQWDREGDGAAVDLHRTIHGCERLVDDVVWAEVNKATRLLEVGAVVVATPRPAVLTLHLALHLTADDSPGSQAWLDLAKAVDQVDRGVWREAADLARRLGIDGEVGAKIRMLSPTLAAELGLTGPPPLQLLLAREGAGAVAVGRLGELKGIGKKARYCLQKLFPPRSYLHASSPAPRRPSDGNPSRLRRVGWCLLHLPAAVAGWRRATRALRGDSSQR